MMGTLRESRKALNTWVTIAFFTITCVGGCQMKTNEEGMRLAKLFEGYQVLMVDSIPRDLNIRNIDTTTLHNTYPTEALFNSGRIYIFRKTGEQSNYDHGMTILPDRLRQVGATIIRVPQSPGDFRTIYLGGPLFTIGFEMKGHHGLIFNSAHTSEVDNENWDELCVLWE
jgi:hypothetical protein